MSRLAQDRKIWLSKDFDKPLVTASYFGFVPVEAPKISREDLGLREELGEHPHFDPAEIAAFMKMYTNENLASEPHPLSLSYKRSTPGRGADKYLLHFVGCNQGVADAALIRSTISILGDFGHKRLVVELNSVGDKDSQSTFERELNSHIRKHINSLSEELQEEIKNDIFRLFHLEHDEIETVRDSAPTTLASLTVPSRNYFKDVLEYLEALGIEFYLSNSLVGNKHYCSHTLFTIRDTENHKVVAAGFHSDKLGKRFGMKKEVPLASAVIFTDPEKFSSKNHVYKDLPKHKFCFIHLGREAKMRALPIIEDLRREHIRVHHLLGKDKITVQLSSAESLPVSHIIIVGQKEAMEGSATVRNVTTRAQDTVPLPQLASYLKKLSA